jgi:hypothetical protein
MPLVEETLAGQKVDLHLPDLVPHPTNGGLRVALPSQIGVHSIGVEVSFSA